MWNCLLTSPNILSTVEVLGYKPHDGMAEEACSEMLRQRPLWLGPSACTSEPFGKTRSSKCGNHEDHVISVASRLTPIGSKDHDFGAG
jgi:hypothetical protein